MKATIRSQLSNLSKRHKAERTGVVEADGTLELVFGFFSKIEHPPIRARGPV